MTQPQLSIIIPHFNQPGHLRRCLDALLAQETPDLKFEIIVVDNGSTTVPVELCQSYKAVTLLREARPGPGPARSLGAANARAGIFAFIDADCVAHPDWLRSISKALRDPDCSIIGGDVKIGYRNADNLTQLEAYETIFAYRQEEYIKRKGFSGTGNLAMRRAAFEAVGPFAGIEVAEDVDWGHRAHAKGYRISYVPEMIVYHPARETFQELTRKWDRHISHDFEAVQSGRRSRLRWLLRTMAVAASALIDLRKTLFTARLPNWRARLGASWILFRIRAYRVKQMLRLLFGSSKSPTSKVWNSN